jgi:hypothetical protein
VKDERKTYFSPEKHRKNGGRNQEEKRRETGILPFTSNVICDKISIDTILTNWSARMWRPAGRERICKRRNT